MLHPPSVADTDKRLRCARCLRPQRTCICQWITPTASAVELLLLQHPLETKNAKNSAHLLHLSLFNSKLVIGEQLDEAALQTLLHAPFENADSGNDAKKISPILLYPQDAQQSARTDTGTTSQPATTASCLRLVVLDGTWRKSRKMLALNPLLQQLPRLSLHDAPASHYTIRKAHHPHQLSTYEASCLALMQLENNAEKYQALLTAFDGFVAQQAAQISQHARPAATKN